MDESDYLQLSGLQHFAFCRRQWALIHIENLWAENYRTVDGEIMHQNAHDSTSRESRGDLKITRGMYIHSAHGDWFPMCRHFCWRGASGEIWTDIRRSFGNKGGL